MRGGGTIITQRQQRHEGSIHTMTKYSVSGCFCLGCFTFPAQILQNALFSILSTPKFAEQGSKCSAEWEVFWNGLSELDNVAPKRPDYQTKKPRSRALFAPQVEKVLPGSKKVLHGVPQPAPGQKLLPDQRPIPSVPVLYQHCHTHRLRHNFCCLLPARHAEQRRFHVSCTTIRSIARRCPSLWYSLCHLFTCASPQ